jgi:hypothetical protein
VLKYGDGIQRIEHAVAKRQTTHVGRRKLDSQVVGCGLLARGKNLGDHEVDSDQSDLRDLEATDSDLGESLAAADVKDTVPRPRLQRLRQKLSEHIVPPRLAQVLESR